MLYVTVFLTGAIVLVIEIAGARLISPFFGSTIFVWSSLISTTLGFLSLGYFLGGRFSHRHPEPRVFYALILVSGIVLILVVKILEPLLIFSDRFGLVYGPLVASVLIFALPVTLLGMLSPFVVGLLGAHGKKEGSVSGKVFAISTGGSLLGALLTGFVLIPHVFLSTLFIGCGIVLFALGLLGIFLFSFKINRIGLSFFLFVGLSVLVWPAIHVELGPAPSFHSVTPSFYTDYKVAEGRPGTIKCLIAGSATQSCQDKTTGETVFSYAQEFAALAEEYQRKNIEKENHIFLIGLGAGALPRLLNSSFYLDIAEIDPVVANFAADHFGFVLKQNQNLFIDDGRHYLRKTLNVYDLVFIDAYVGNTTPIHLLSKEFFELVKDHLVAGGSVILNTNALTDANDPYLSALVSTLRSVFPFVKVTTPPETSSKVRAFVIHASKDPESSLKEVVYKPLNFEVSQGEIITDEKNPSELIQLGVQENFRISMFRYGGYRLFFQQ